MKEYKKRLDEIKTLRERARKIGRDASDMDSIPDNYDTILRLFDDAKKMRKKAEKQLEKLASDLGFKILKSVKTDIDFMDVWYSIDRQIERAMEALYNISTFEHNIELA